MTTPGPAILTLTAPAVRHVRPDGPALRVRAHQDADRWYPLRRLAELRLIGPVPLDGAVIPTCLKAGINVYFYSDSKWLGVACAARRAEPGALATLIDEFWLLSDADQRFGALVHGYQRRAVIDYYRRTAQTQGELRFHPLLAAARARIEAVHPQLLQRWECVRQRLRAEASTALLALGLGHDHLNARRSLPSLPGLITNLAELRAIAELGPQPTLRSAAARKLLKHAFADKFLPSSLRRVHQLAESLCQQLASRRHEA